MLVGLLYLLGRVMDMPGESRSQAVRQLSELLRGGRLGAASERVSSGCEPLDRLLPERGLARGSLAEWLGESGAGATMLALLAARQACRDGGVLVVVDRAQTFYPPSAAAWGVGLAEMLIARPQNDSDEHWVLDQSLRCDQVAAVLAWPMQLDSYTFRR
ncbi:MAG: hypothetical protein QF805_13265, partial [Pirellulaceae bacterium]|nr:hypothetical protein [Pirellulaceae bacterium]